MSANSSLATRQNLATGRKLRSASIKVWDPFVRVFHWSLVVLFAAAWYSGGIWDRPHLAAGYLVLLLILARIIWGFIGSQHARFASFIHGPATTLRYVVDMLRMRAPRYLGHNPAGAVMVMSLLATLLVLCVTGVMMTTDAFWGVKWVDNIHAAASTFALILVGLHVGGVIFAGMEHRENLVKAMFTGTKRVE